MIFVLLLHSVKIISDGSNTILSNIDRTRTSFFEHRTNSNVFICWWSNSNTLFLASNDRTSNFEPNRAFTTLTKSLIELTRTSFFRTSNELERVHLMVIELKHPIFGFERSNFEHCSTHHYKAYKRILCNTRIKETQKWYSDAEVYMEQRDGKKVEVDLYNHDFEY